MRSAAAITTLHCSQVSCLSRLLRSVAPYFSVHDLTWLHNHSFEATELNRA